MKKQSSIILAALVTGMMAPALAAPDPGTMVLMCDTNNDNAVIKQEWQACGAPTAYPENADKNKDGKVTVEEMAGSQSSSAEPPALPQQ